VLERPAEPDRLGDVAVRGLAQEQRVPIRDDRRVRGGYAQVRKQVGHAWIGLQSQPDGLAPVPAAGIADAERCLRVARAEDAPAAARGSCGRAMNACRMRSRRLGCVLRMRRRASVASSYASLSTRATALNVAARPVRWATSPVKPPTWWTAIVRGVSPVSSRT